MAPRTRKATEATADDEGLYAVYDATLGRYVSGVGDKATADASRAELAKVGYTKGHKLQVRSVAK